MKEKSYMRESLESYLLVFALSLFFFGGIIVAGEATGHDWSAAVPDFSWEMINTWSEISGRNMD